MHNYKQNEQPISVVTDCLQFFIRNDEKGRTEDLSIILLDEYGFANIVNKQIKRDENAGGTKYIYHYVLTPQGRELREKLLTSKDVFEKRLPEAKS